MLKKLNNTVLIFIALILGIFAGLALNGNPKIATDYIQPLGNIFVGLIKFIVAPIVLCTIAAGVISLRDIKKVASIGGKTIVFYLVTTFIAVTIGLIVANICKNLGWFPPLDRLAASVASAAGEAGELTEAAKSPGLSDILMGMFPNNFIAPLSEVNMLQIIVMALLIGFGTVLAGDKGKPFAAFVESFSEVCVKIIGMIMRLAPVGVFCLITPVVADGGVEIIRSLGLVILAAWLGFAAHLFTTYLIMVKVFAGMSPKKFLKGIAGTMLFAMSTTSSMATLPVNIENTVKMGAKRETANFVLPLGATVNMDGLAIYQATVVTFVASAFGVSLSFPQLVLIAVTATVASIGMAGVPGSGVLAMSILLQAVGLPIAGVGLAAGIDRFLDMGSTTMNVTGDCTVAVCVSAMDERKKGKAGETPEEEGRDF